MLINKGKTNWKYILIVLILALLVGGGILWWTKTQEVPLAEFPGLKKPEKPPQDETANWQTYRNEKYGFEIKYPDNFTIEEPVSDVAIVKSGGKEYLQIQYFYLISTPPKPENYIPNSASFIGIVNIGNKKADKYYTVKPQGEGGVIENTPYTNYVITLGDKEWIQIDYYGEKEVASSFEKMLSTFRFIK